MKIEAPSQQPAIPELAKVRKGVKPAAVVEQPKQAIKVQLTDQVKILSKKAIVADTGELEAVQAAKVQAIKARVTEGNYQVDARDIADKILSSSSDKS